MNEERREYNSYWRRSMKAARRIVDKMNKAEDLAKERFFGKRPDKHTYGKIKR